MKISGDYEDARLNIRRTADLVGMHEAHLRRLVRRGVFPKPKRTTKGMPFFDFELLSTIVGVMRRGIGVSGEEVSFYRRNPRSQKRPSSRNGKALSPQRRDPFVAAIIDGCRQLGITEQQNNSREIEAVIRDEFGANRLPLRDAIPKVVRRLVGEL